MPQRFLISAIFVLALTASLFATATSLAFRPTCPVVGQDAAVAGLSRRAFLATVAGLFDAPGRDVVGLVAALIDARGGDAAAA